MRSRAVALSFALIPLLASCRGGASGLPASSGAPAGPGSAAFTITVPPRAGTAAIAQSAVVTLVKVNGNAQSGAVPSLAMNLTATTPGCTAATSGGLTCIVRLTVPSGQDSFTIATYSAANSSGTQLSNDQVTTAISAAKQTTCVKPAAAAAPAAVPGASAAPAATAPQAALIQGTVH